MPVYFFRSDPGAAELRRLARRENGRVCQRVLMIANMLEGMEHEEAARLAGLSRSAAYEWHNRYEEDGLCRRPIKMSPLCHLQMTLPGGFPGGVGGDGSADERWGA